MDTFDAQYWNQVSQIFIAIAGTFVACFAYLQHRKSQKNKRIDIAISANRDWDNSINKYTSALIALVTDFWENKDIMERLKNNLPIKLDLDPRSTKRYGIFNE